MQGKAESSVLHKAQEPWGGCWKAVGSGVTTISPGGSGHMERVEIEAPFSSLSSLSFCPRILGAAAVSNGTYSPEQ